MFFTLLTIWASSYCWQKKLVSPRIYLILGSSQCAKQGSKNPKQDQSLRTTSRNARSQARVTKGTSPTSLRSDAIQTDGKRAWLFLLFLAMSGTRSLNCSRGCGSSAKLQGHQPVRRQHGSVYDRRFQTPSRIHEREARGR